MISLICALKAESNEGIEGLFPVTYSGVGKINATIAALNLIKTNRPTNIINFGTAGGRPELLNKIVRCSSFFQRDIDCSEIGHQVGITPFEDIPTILTFHYENWFDKPFLCHYVCASGDNFYTEKTFSKYDVVDMEAYAIAKVCYLHNVQFTSFKFITDNGDESAAFDWNLNLAKSADLFFDLFKKLHEKINENSSHR